MFDSSEFQVSFVMNMLTKKERKEYLKISFRVACLSGYCRFKPQKAQNKTLNPRLFSVLDGSLYIYI